MSDENNKDTEQQENPLSVQDAIIAHGKSVKSGLESIASALNWIALASVLIAVTHCSGK